MKKKSLLLLVCVLALVFAACGNADAPAATTGEEMATELKMGRAQYAAHGNSGWADVVVAMEGDKIVGVSLDEYQFMNVEDATPVPNALVEGEKALSNNFKDPKVAPASKRVNSDFYSGMMTEYAKSTVSIAANFDAIEAFCTGKTVAELKTAVEGEKKEVTDMVTGATLVDAKGYIEAVIAACEAVK